MWSQSVNGTEVVVLDELCGAEWDAVVLVTAGGAVGGERGAAPPQLLEDFVAAHHELDPASKERGAVSVVRCARVAGARLLLAAAGELGPYDDVRCISEAMRAGVRRARRAGAGRVAVCAPRVPAFPRAPLAALLGALEATYQPLQIRESFPARARPVAALGVYAEGLAEPLDKLLKRALAIEHGRAVARDIGGGDPERMTALRCAEHVRGALAGGAVRVRVESSRADIQREYPLLAAVDRCASTVPRHAACVVHLEYAPAEYERTFMFVGKGVTYDTGGCDIKAGGVMAGMSRDKCGAAAIAGLFKTLDLLAPKVRAVASLAFVRNSVGADAYVSDELLGSRRGLPVRVGNTDAEGRMAMADLLAEMAERAHQEKNPHLYTVATLTGHAHRTVGEGYSIVLDNHAARERGHAAKLAQAGDSVGDMIEISTIRREDLAFHRGRCAGDALHQADSRPSVNTPRGHQGPAGFLLLAAGLEGGDTPYSHVDVAASAGSLPAPPTAAPLAALAAHMGLLD